MSEIKEALLRSMMVATAPQSSDELLLVIDALRMWHANPGLRNELVAKRNIDSKPMMERCAMVLAMMNMSIPDKLPPEHD